MVLFLHNWQPKDVIALLVLAGCFVLIGLGVDSFVSATITLIIGYYFAKRQEMEDRRP